MESHTENGIMGESCAASKEKGIALADAYCNALWKYSPTKDCGVSLYDGF